MKVLKGFLSVLISLVIMVLVSLLVSSFLLKSLVQNQVVGNVVKTEMITEVINDSDIENKEEIIKLLDDKDLNKVINETIEDFIDAINNDRTELSPKTIDSIIDYTVEHKSEIEKITNEKINVEDIKSQSSYNELSRSLNEVLKETDSLGSTEKTIIKAYGFFTSNTFRIILIAVIIGLIVALALLKGSWYMWLSSVGGALIASGILMSALYAAVQVILKEFVRDPALDITINPKNILIVGIFEIVVGIALVITKTIIKNAKEEKPLENNEIIEDKQV